MDKHKLKNIALGVSLGLNVLLGFFLGGGLISSCTAKKAENPASSVSADANGEIVDCTQKRALTPRFAANDDFDPDAYENLWKTSGSDYSVHYQTVLYHSNDPTLIAVGFSEAGICEFNRIRTAGLYYVEVQRSASWGDGFWINQTSYETILTWGSTSTTYTTFLGEDDGYFYVTQAMVDAGLYLAVSQANRNAILPKVYLIDGDVMPAVDYVTFPADYNPLVMFGQPFDGYLWGNLSGLSSTPRFIEKTIPVLFRYNGVVYKNLRVSFYQCNGGYYQADDGSIKTWANNDSTSMYYPSIVIADRADGGNDTIWLIRFGAYGEGSTYVARTGYFVNAPTATFAVLDYDEGGNGYSGMFPSKNALQLLTVRTTSSAGVVIGGDGNADIFGLFGNAFTSVAGILNIQILPYLTLGTILFVPLVVLIILAILRLLAK